MKRKKGTRAQRQTIPHSHVWATLTLATFLLTYIAAILSNAPSVMPFVYAGGAFIAMLAVEALVRGRIWPLEQTYREKFADMDGIALRLMFVSGAVLLTLELVLLISMWI